MNLKLMWPPALEAYYFFPCIVQHFGNAKAFLHKLSREFEVVRRWACIREGRGTGTARRRHLRSRSKEVAEKLGYGVERQVGRDCENES